eukprot:Clim_evm34s128 gene=Clim_evmTU34s128
MFGGGKKCPLCSKTVYMAEEVQANGKSYHKLCFKCEACNKLLDSTSLTERGESIFCKNCYTKKFGPEGFGAARVHTKSENPDGATTATLASGGSSGNINSAPRFGGGAKKCPVCNKSVYAAEELQANGKSFHKLCFKCRDCNSLLDSTKVCERGDDLYCKSCYTKNFGPEGFGAARAHTNTGADAQPASSTVGKASSGENLSKPQGITARFGGGAPKCPVCSKSVYAAEKAEANSKSYHKLCLKCNTCNKLLDSTSLNERRDDIFCNGCYSKKFGPEGFGAARAHTQTEA